MIDGMLNRDVKIAALAILGLEVDDQALICTLLDNVGLAARSSISLTVMGSVVSMRCNMAVLQRIYVLGHELH